MRAGTLAGTIGTPSSRVINGAMANCADQRVAESRPSERARTGPRRIEPRQVRTSRAGLPHAWQGDCGAESAEREPPSNAAGIRQMARRRAEEHRAEPVSSRASARRDPPRICGEGCARTAAVPRWRRAPARAGLRGTRRCGARQTSSTAITTGVSATPIVRFAPESPGISAQPAAR